MIQEKKIIQSFLSTGYSIVDLDNLKKLDKIKNEIFSLSRKILNIKNLQKDLFFDNTQNYVKPNNLNKFKIEIISKINSKRIIKDSYYDLSQKVLDIIVGNEIAMQKNINLSVQLPNDKNSVLPLHADTWSGNSPFETVIWLPLVDCKKTKSMFILPQSKYLKYFNEKNLKKISNTDQLFNFIKKDLKWITINYGQLLIFNQSLPHGNVINREKQTRWSLNCRFKSLFSPYGEKKLGEFFEVKSIKPISSLGLEYQFPKFKKYE